MHEDRVEKKDAKPDGYTGTLSSKAPAPAPVGDAKPSRAIVVIPGQQWKKGEVRLLVCEAGPDVAVYDMLNGKRMFHGSPFHAEDKLKGMGYKVG